MPWHLELLGRVEYFQEPSLSVRLELRNPRPLQSEHLDMQQVAQMRRQLNIVSLLLSCVIIFIHRFQFMLQR
ncbi:hypothetical protein WN51_03107 [Melipona quadrifasciata]|uniref:Uncharacterized protein n=1 Tax=Melipona quadrifasciata TaxID=166423 RepID=A0A0M8ZZ14_9HYME|nr:hypothetical protein WN51_03107 [Melipona quadrifasciata]